MLEVSPPRLLGDPNIPATAQQQPNSDAELIRLVGEADGHTASTLANGYSLGLDVLGDIVLPPEAEANVDRAQMRALGALYLAADLEPARLIASAESLSALAASNSINVDLGAVGPLVHDFWRKRNDRITSMERLAFFGGLFGASYGSGPAEGYVNSQFEPIMLELCEALYRLDELASDPIHGGIGQQMRLRASARNLISNLVTAGGGITAFFAIEIIRLLKDALGILKHPHLRGIFMARDIWGVVAGINRLTRLRTADPRNFVRRGRAGMSVIVWLAEIAEQLLHQSGPLIRLDHPVIPAAVDWLQASLVISEHQGQTESVLANQESSQSTYAPGITGQWADIGI